MSEPRTCPSCRRPIPEDAPSGVCPHCALEAGFPSVGATAAMPGPPAAVSPAEEVARHFPELERFEIIGPGGMGTVYRARQRELGRPVAVKVMHPHLASEPTFADRFNREARTLARLDHPNIVRVYDGGHRDGLAYLVMELVEGVTLRQAIQAGGIEPAEALAMVPRICSALQYAHDNGVVHRDIKPENILLDREGSPKVADFGLAKLVGAVDVRLTVGDELMGTPHYMAPEQIEHPDRVDHRADIFALGVVFYEMLTGELPMGRFPPPSEKVQLDVRLDRVVLKTLEKEPRRRYQHASDLGSEVEALSRPGGAAPVESAAAPELASAGAEPRRTPWRPLVAAAVVVAIAVVAVVYLRTTGLFSAPSGSDRAASTGPPLTAIAVLPFDDMSPEGDQGWLADGMAEELIEAVSRIQELRVIARTSAFALRGQEIQSVGARLGVGAVVQGSVRRSGDQLRITAQLVRASDGSQLWSARYDRQLDDLFAIQSEIARDIAEAIRSELGIDETPMYRSLSRGRYVPRDVRAYELMRKGIEIGTFALTEEALLEGSEYYRQALEIDPGYADAHAMLGLHHGLLWILGYDRTEGRSASARALAGRALELDESNATAHQVLALVDMFSGEFRAAERRLEGALEVHPRNGGLRMRYAEVLAQTGRLDEAVSHAQSAARLDPLAPARQFELGLIYLLAGRFEDAIERLRHTLELNPRQLAAGAYLASAYYLNGMERKALKTAVRNLPERSRGLEAPMRSGFEEGGYAGMVRALNQQLVELTGNPCGFDAGLSAHFYAISGEADKMYPCLDEVVAAGRGWDLYLKVHPTWEPYRAQPRFQEILRRLGLA